MYNTDNQMEAFSKYFLVAYYILFFGFAMILPTYRTWKATGTNPYKLGSSDSAHDYIGKNFRLVMLASFVATIVALFPNAYSFLLPMTLPVSNFLIAAGFVLLLFALAWVLIAQNHMKKSWRIGIDEDVRTDLVQIGLFKISPTPFFSGCALCCWVYFSSFPTRSPLSFSSSVNCLPKFKYGSKRDF